jgi:hypothetical protein
MFRRSRFAVLGQLLIAVAAGWCGTAGAAEGVAWQPAANDGDIERSFATARS